MTDLTFIPTESRSKAAQEAIRVHVLRHRHRQRRESRRIRGKDDPVVGHHGGQFQIWQPSSTASLFVQSGSLSPDSICRHPPDPYVDLDLSIQDEGIECISPSIVGRCAELDSATENQGSTLDRRAIEEMLIQYCERLCSY